MLLVALKPQRFETLAVIFAFYTIVILYLTA
jgi:hypothetical protein